MRYSRGLRFSKAKPVGSFRVYHPSTRRVVGQADSLREARTDAGFWSKQSPNPFEVQERFPSGKWVTVETVGGSGRRSHAAVRGHATARSNDQRAESIAFGAKWAEDRFREDPEYSAFTLNMVSIDPAVVPSAKKREAMKQLICTAAVKRWRELRDQAKLSVVR